MTSIYFFDMRSDEGFYSPKPASNCTSSSCFLPNGPPFNPKLGTKVRVVAQPFPQICVVEWERAPGGVQGIQRKG